MIKVALSPFLGLDEYTYPHFLKEGMSPYAVNVEVDGGILRSCDGFTAAEGVPSASHALWHYGRGEEKVLLLLSGGNLCRETGEVLKEGYFADGDMLSWVNYQLNDQYITILCNGRTAPLKYDGVQVTELGGAPPVCGLVELHSERIFMAGQQENPDRVYYSASFAPEDWQTAEKTGFIDIPTWNGGKIRGIRSLFGDLVVFKDQDIFRIYGTYPGEFGVEKVHSAVGCVAGNTIVSTGEQCFFLSEKGLCVYNGLAAKPFGDKRLEAIFAQVDFSRMTEACCMLFDGKLYLSLPMEEDIVVEYDVQTGTLGKKKGIGVRQFFVRDGKLWFVHRDGRICRYGAGQDFGGHAISSCWRSKTYDLQAKNAVKHLEEVYCRAKGSGEMVFRSVCDGKAREKHLTLSPDFRHYRLPLHGRGRSFFLEMANVNGSQFVVDAPCVFVDVEED